MKASYKTHILRFKFAAGTSRAILHTKPCVYLMLEQDGHVGIGECSTIVGLSLDTLNDDYLAKLDELCSLINAGESVLDFNLQVYPSIAFGLETALLDLNAKGSKVLFESDFTSGKLGIPINGLIWMGDKAFMQKQISEKINAGYRCLKLKVGALDFETELDIINQIRRNFSASDLELRLDANGGFSTNEALNKLHQLANYQIHSIEQPIKAAQWEAMAQICAQSPIPIALDEELIGLPELQMKPALELIKPAYIILKPSMLGGFTKTERWIEVANKYNIEWWVTSALESNIGLNAIAQWTYTLNSSLPQGLGTGQLYHNNINSPLEIKNAQLYYNSELSSWGEINKLA